jgi:segregation and condensation protein B
MEVTEIKYFVEAALLAAGKPLSIDQLKNLFDEASSPEKAEIREAIAELQGDYKPRGIEVQEVASGFRMQVKATMAERLERLWEERPPRYSRALFETLALIAYRQPMTRGEIEEIRGVAVSSNIIRSLLERDWIRVVGHRDVPGRPSMFGTTRQFLDYFGLKKLDDLPPLADLSDWESLRVQLNLPATEEELRDERESAENDDSVDPDASAIITRLPIAERAEKGANDDVEDDSDDDADDDAAVATIAGDAEDSAESGDEVRDTSAIDAEPGSADASADAQQADAGEPTAEASTDESIEATREQAVAADDAEDVDEAELDERRDNSASNG